MSKPFQEAIESALSALEIDPDATWLVAVSGGPDSVALARAFHELDVPIAIAHFNHGTRGEASAEDEAFVAALAQELGVPFYSRAEDVAADAEATNLSFEEYARERRYAFLIGIAKAEGYGGIATGHHADDQAETVLMRVIRGATPRGLAGIPAVTERDGVRIVRPLLRLRRAEILGYLREHGLAYREDESNQELGFVRNRVRHELLPQLARVYNPRVTEALNRLADAQRVEDDLLRSFADKFMQRCVRPERTIQVDAFAAGHLALQRRLVLALAWRYGVRPDFDHVDRAIDFILNAKPRKTFDLGNGVQLASGMGTVAVVPFKPSAPEDGEIALSVPGETYAWDRGVRVTLLDALPAESLDVYCTLDRQVVDAESLGASVIVRHRRPGDRFRPMGLGGTRKVKDYFSDLGVPPEERDRALIIEAKDAIVWIAGYAVSEAGAVTPATKRCAVIEVTHEAK